MKALHFRARSSDEGRFEVPPEISLQIPPRQDLQVIVLLPETSEDLDWARQTLAEFAKHDDEGDAIYDDLSPPG